MVLFEVLQFTEISELGVRILRVSVCWVVVQGLVLRLRFRCFVFVFFDRHVHILEVLLLFVSQVGRELCGLNVLFEGTVGGEQFGDNYQSSGCERLVADESELEQSLDYGDYSVGVAVLLEGHEENIEKYIDGSRVGEVGIQQGVIDDSKKPIRERVDLVLDLENQKQQLYLHPDVGVLMYLLINDVYMFLHLLLYLVEERFAQW